MVKRWRQMANNTGKTRNLSYERSRQKDRRPTDGRISEINNVNIGTGEVVV
jgi:hypothetical protein